MWLMGVILGGYVALAGYVCKLDSLGQPEVAAVICVVVGGFSMGFCGVMIVANKWGRK